MAKSKAPEYAKTSYDTGGLFGSSTTNKSGTTFKPIESMTNAGNTAWGGLNTSLQGIGSNDYSNDANFLAYQNQMNKAGAQNYDAQVLSQLANRGLMRSSGLQAATNSFANTLADNTTDLYDSYYNRQANNLANYQNTLNSLYNYITGVNTGSQNNSQNVSNYNLDAWKTQQNNNAALWKGLMETAGKTAGTVGSAAIMASDIRVKENIKKIGERNGFNWYEFNYKKGYGLPAGRQEGVIAQEVEQVKPEAVIDVNGIKHVDYSKI